MRRLIAYQNIGWRNQWKRTPRRCSYVRNSLSLAPEVGMRSSAI